MNRFSLYPHDYRCFLIHTGYIEDQSVTGVMFTHRLTQSSKHKTWQGAWEMMFTHLREAMRAALSIELGVTGETPKLDPCCERNILDPHAMFCANCGRNLREVRESQTLPTDPEELSNHYRSLLSRYRQDTTNSLGLHCEKVWNGDLWAIGGGPEQGILTIIYSDGERFFGEYDLLKENSRFWSGDQSFFKNMVFVPIGPEFGLPE